MTDSSETPATKSQAVQLERIREISDGDTEFETEIVNLFIDDQRERMQDVRAALNSGDAEALKKQAHAMKGASANIGANTLHQIASQLEKLGAEGQLEQAGHVFDQLQTESERVCECLRRYLER